MNKQIMLSIFVLVLLSSSVLAETFTRTTPVTTIMPNSNFEVTYTAEGPIGKYFVTWEDAITGGCTPNSYKRFIATETGGIEKAPKIFTAPVSGSCKFQGFYQYAGGNTVMLPDLTINIIAPECTEGTSRACNATNGCSTTQSCAQGKWLACTTTLNKCSDGSCQVSCPIVSCTTGQTQTCSIGNCSGIQTCSNNAFGNCVQSSPTCGTNTNQTSFDYCKYTSKAAFFKVGDLSDCTIGTFTIIIGVIILIILIK